MHVYLADDFVHGGAVGGRGAGDRIRKRTPESEYRGGKTEDEGPNRKNREPNRTEPKPRSSVRFQFLVLKNRSAQFNFGFYAS